MNNKIIFWLLFFMFAFLAVSFSDVVYKNDFITITASNILIAGKTNIKYIPIETDIVRSTKNNIFNKDSFYGESGMSFVVIKATKNKLTHNLIFNSWNYEIPIQTLLIKTIMKNLKTNYITSPYIKLVYKDTPLNFVSIETNKKERNSFYILSDFYEFEEINFVNINIIKGLANKTSERSNVKKNNTQNSGTQSKDKTKKVQTYTVVIMTTTPLLQILNPINQDTYIILQGKDYNKKHYLGKISGATQIYTEFTDVPNGKYKIIIKWGNKNILKEVTVSSDDQFIIDWNL